jgi:hypothetical protein
MRYEITEANEVKIYNDGDDIPFWYQPDYPNGDNFDDAAEAEAWAKLAVASFSDSEPFAPIGKGLAGEPKPTAEELAAKKSNRIHSMTHEA